MEEEWKVVYIASRQEKKVAIRLAQEGIEHYLPLYQKLSQWSDRKKWVEWPLFNGYLFVKPTPLQREKVLSLQGVVAFVRYNKADAVVKQTEIDIIQQVLESGYTLESYTKPEDFTVGDEVLITEGALIGHKGEILRHNNKEYFLVSFETLGQSLKIELPAHSFKKTTIE